MAKTAPSLDRTVRLRDRVLFREIDREAVLLDLESGRYYGLDEVGTQIWKLLRAELTPAAVLDRLVEEYEASAERLESDLLGFLDELAEARLVEVGSG